MPPELLTLDHVITHLLNEETWQTSSGRPVTIIAKSTVIPSEHHQNAHFYTVHYTQTEVSTPLALVAEVT